MSNGWGPSPPGSMFWPARKGCAAHALTSASSAIALIACNPDTVLQGLCQGYDLVRPQQVQGASDIKPRRMTCFNRQQHGLTVGHELVAALTLFAIVYTPMKASNLIHRSAVQEPCRANLMWILGLFLFILQRQSRLCEGCELARL